MKVFVTGASGLIGRSTLRELVAHGHEVVGLARSDKSAATITAQGGTPHTGSLEDLESLRTGAATADAAVHLGFIHDDFSEDGLRKAQAVDRAAIQTIGDALAAGKGADAPFIVASGTMSLVPAAGGVADEDSQHENTGTAFGERVKASQMLLDMAAQNKVRGMVVRFAPTVHGKDDGGLVPIAIKLMKAAGQAIYVGEGNGKWCACHVEDAAALVRLAVEKGRSGAVYHAVGEEGVSMKAMAELVGKKTGMEVVGLSVPEAMEKLQFLGGLLAAQNVVSSQRTQKELGWTPTHDGLLEDMDANYF